jgi:hypothetical protein
VPIIDSEDVEVILGRELTTDEDARVDRLLTMAEGALEDALPGFSLATGSETVDIWRRGDTAIGPDGTIWTPRYPVTAITSIKVLDLTVPFPFGYRFDLFGQIIFAPWENWLPVINAPWLAQGFTPYVVNYNFGLSTVPADIASAIAAPVAAMLRQQKANPDDLTSESIGSYNVRYRSKGDLDPGSVGVLVAAAVRDQLRRWRRTRQVSVPLAHHL